MFKSFWGSQEQQGQQRPDEIPTNSWYPPSVNSPSTSRPGTPSSNASSNSFNLQRPADRGPSSSHVSPSEAASIISLLKDKSVDELQKLLSDKDGAYQHFLHSVDQVKIQKNLREELRKETLKLARLNVEKEPVIMELRNQCRIIRTSELAAAEEKLNELERQKKESLKACAPSSLLYRLEEAMKKTDEESEALHRQLLDGEIEVAAFVQKYKKLRNVYHKRALTLLAAKTSFTG